MEGLIIRGPAMLSAFCPPVRPLLVAKLSVLLSLLLLPEAALSADGEAQPFRMGPPAAWVQPLRLPGEEVVRSAERAAAGSLYLLIDEQTRVGQGTVERYVHRARRVLSANYEGESADIRIIFDPSFERLTLHGVWRVRDGQRQEVLHPAKVNVFQRENDLLHRRYDGALLVEPFIADVQAGDVLEVAYSIHGVSPLLGGRYTGRFDVEFDTPVVHWRQRLLWPVERPLEIVYHGTSLRSSQSEAKDVRECVWELWDLPAVKQGNGGTRVRPFAWVQLSEYKAWKEVARWAARLFAVPARSPQVEQVAQRLMKTPSEEERFLAALRFVQDEVRSIPVPLSASSGPISSPDEVLSRRLGDAKDKALLLLTLLHALGFEARASLVNTDSEDGLETWHPSPGAFNHVIVRATVGGQVIWVDPMNTLERGPLASRQPPVFGRALIADPGAVSLVEIPCPPLQEPTLFVEERYTAVAINEPGELRMTTLLTGWEADRMRRKLASSSREALAAERLERVAREGRVLHALEPLSVEDDEVGNTIALHERYALEPLMQGAWSRGFDATSVRERLPEPAWFQDVMASWVEHPVFVRHRVIINAPEPLRIDSERVEVEGPLFRFVRDAQIMGHQLVLDYSYQSLASQVTPEFLSAHAEALGQVQELLTYRNWIARGNGPSTGFGAWGYGVLGLIFLVGLVLVFFQRTPWGVWQDTRKWWRRRAFARKFKLGEGDTAQSAIAVRGREELLSTIDRMQCACGENGMDASAPYRGESVTYGERQLVLMHWRCPGCGVERRAYFEHRAFRMT